MDELDLSKLTPAEIKQIVDSAIVDYVEGRIPLEKLIQQINPYDDNEVFFILEKSPYRELISLLDIIGYIPYDEYNNPQSTQAVIKGYYDKIRG